MEASPSETPTPTETVEFSPTPTATATETPTETLLPSETPMESPTPTETFTETPTPTPTATMTATPTATPTATAPPPQTNGQATYTYDGDGNMVKSIIGSVTTYYPRREYELRVEGVSETIFKYYFTTAGRTALRVNGVLTWLMVDQVGSTSVTSDINGALGDTVKYSAYGEVRSGGTATDYLYTSQRNEAEIGLNYYVARFYDPVIGHFIQADTILPEAGSSKAYDRYGYVGYNPINFNDPSGHIESDDRVGGTTDALRYVLKYRYNWNLLGKWDVNQGVKVLEAGKEVSRYIQQISNKAGDQWLRTNLGGVRFEIGTLLTSVLQSSTGISKNSIQLLSDFETIGWEGGAKGMIIHEIAHVIDNRSKKGFGLPAVISGGGISDNLIKFTGGNPSNPFRFDGKVITKDSSFISPYLYGNNSSADYFAHAFMCNVLGVTGTKWGMAERWVEIQMKYYP